ncbi:hypothetical protein C8R46DRAFT_1036954 [Mycena filopes]|nr:hypothetical protein C8R46DRAFT_1036954 [Mycena filopes]
MAPVDTSATIHAAVIYTTDDAQQHFEAPGVVTAPSTTEFATITPFDLALPSAQVSVLGLDHTASRIELSNATSPPALDMATLSMDAGVLSQKVLISIIVGLMIFVGCYASFCCFWRPRLGLGGRSSGTPPPPPASRRTALRVSATVAGRPSAAGQGVSSPRSSSYTTSTLVAESDGHTDVLVKDDASATNSTNADGVEMGPILQRPQRARVAHSRPRMPLVEVGM